MNVHITRFDHESWCLYCFELIKSKELWSFMLCRMLGLMIKKIIVHMSIKCYSRSIWFLVCFLVELELLLWASLRVKHNVSNRVHLVDVN